VSIFYGDLPDALRTRKEPVKDAPPAMLAGMGALAALIVIFGVAPQLLMKWVVAPAAQGLGMAWQGTVTWLGLQTGSVSLPVTAGAGMTLLAALVGWAFYAMTRTNRPASRASGKGELVFTGGDPLPEGDRVGSVDFSELAGSTIGPVYRYLNPDPVYDGVWRLTRSAGQKLVQMVSGLESHALLASLVAVIVLAAVAWIW
jgi:multicomponent Na+:H+ antiporter subunit A